MQHISYSIFFPHEHTGVLHAGIGRSLSEELPPLLSHFPSFLPRYILVTQQVAHVDGACMISFAQCLVMQRFDLLTIWKQVILKSLTSVKVILMRRE